MASGKVSIQPENLPLALSTPLGADRFLVAALRGREAISELFRYELELLADPEAEVPFDKLVNQPATLRLRGKAGSSRFISGVISRFTEADIDEDYAHYGLELVPRFWQWTKVVQSRVFQQQSVPEILKQVLQGLKINWNVSRSYPALNYCVQYRESDFHFASRLMENAGIYYYFVHQAEGDVLVVSDKTQSYPELPGTNVLVYNRGKDVLDRPYVVSWDKSQTAGTPTHTVSDYHFQVSQKQLQASARVSDTMQAGTVTHQLNGAGPHGGKAVDFPGGASTRYDGVGPNGEANSAGLQPAFDEARQLAALAADREACACLEAGGRGSYANLQPGYQVRLERHPNADGDYLLTAVDIEASMSGFLSGAEVDWNYRNRFRCLPAGLRYRPPLRTSKPYIRGPQTAVVMGPSEQPHVDKFGRVKVHFRWDPTAPPGPLNSCWIRVAQAWAGKGWGTMFWPRPGQEVIVAFEDGDPDRPIITGSVYNDAETAPFPLPQQSTIAGIKSQVSSGDPSQFHGVFLNDAAAQAAVQVRSCKDLHLEANSNLVTTGQSYSAASLTMTTVVDQSQVNVTGWYYAPLPINFPSPPQYPSWNWSSVGGVLESAGASVAADAETGWQAAKGVGELLAGVYSSTFAGGERVDLVRGTHNVSTMPKFTQTTIGSHSVLMTNPLTVLGYTPPNSIVKGILSFLGLSGFKEIVYANSTTLHGYSGVLCQGGNFVEGIGTNPLVKLGGYLQTPLAITSFVLGCLTASNSSELLADLLEASEKTQQIAGTVLTSKAGKVPALAAGVILTDAATNLTAQVATCPTGADAFPVHAGFLSASALAVPAGTGTFHNHSVLGTYALQAQGVQMVSTSGGITVVGTTGVPILIDSVDTAVTVASGAAAVNLAGDTGIVTVGSGPASSCTVTATTITLRVGDLEVMVSADAGMVTIASGTDVAIALGSSGITLTVGSNMIEMTSDGITLTGAQVNIVADSSVKISAPEVSVIQA